ncbi:MAG: RhuM family protein [Castellaniella sp.]
MKEISLQDQTTEFWIYNAPNGRVKVEVLLNNETIWLTQERMAELFGVQRPAISKHLKNIFDSGELERQATISILETIQKKGDRHVKRRLEYYNLDTIISVGYRANSAQTTQFRIWATQLIKEYRIGYWMAMAQCRAKTPTPKPSASTISSTGNKRLNRTLTGK